MTDNHPEIIEPNRRPDSENDPVVVPSGYEQIEQVDRSSGIERRERTIVDQTGTAHHESILQDHAAERTLWYFRVEQLIWLILGVIETFIGLRIILKLIAANPTNDFANFVYTFAAFFLQPFFGLTGSPAAGGSVLEIPSLIAMLVYALLFWAIVKVVQLLFARADTRSVSTYNRYRG